MATLLSGRRLNPRHRRFVVAGIVAIGVVTASTAWAAMAVYDSAVHATVSKDLAETVKVLETTQKSLTRAQELNAAIGSQGASLTPNAFMSGLSENMAGLQGLVPDLRSLIPNDDIQANIGSVEAARRFMTETLTLPIPGKDGKTPIAVTRNDVLRSRQQLLQMSALGGLSKALQQQQSIAQSLARIAGAASQAQVSATLRDDLRTTNKLLVLLLQEAVAQRAATAALLEAVAANNVQQVPVNFGGVPGEAITGGTSGNYRLGE